MFKNIIYLFVYLLLLSLWLIFIWIEPQFKRDIFPIYWVYLFMLFLPTIFFLILRYLAEKTKDDKVALKYWVGSLVLAVLSWGGFFVYNSMYIWK